MFALDFGTETRLFTDQFEKKTILGSYRYFSFYSIFQTKFGRKFYRTKMVTVTERSSEEIVAYQDLRRGEEITLAEAEHFLGRTILPWYAPLGNQSLAYLGFFLLLLAYLPALR